MNSIYKKENLRILRRHLGFTQKEFIAHFLSDEEKAMSIATFSNLEAKGGARLNDVILKTADKISVDPMIFAMDPQEFAEQLSSLLPNEKDMQQIQKQGAKKNGINHLINQLTMYFAQQVMDGKLKKGDQIESDRELAAMLNVGRSAIREAMKVLDVLGMVDIRPGQGTYISNNEADFFIIPLSWSLFLNGSQIDNIITVRNLLETKAAELAAGCQDVNCLHDLSRVSHKMQKALLEGDHNDFLEGDLDFHICIARCSGNDVIYTMIQTISNLMRHVSGTGMIYEEQVKEIYDEHQKIYGSILTHDADAAREAMSSHLSKSKMRYRYR